MRKNLKAIYSLLILTAILILPYFVFAQTEEAATANSPMLDKLTQVADSGGYATGESSDLMTIVGMIIRSVLGLLGVIFLSMTIVAGFQWMTASGNEQKVEKAQTMLKQAIIGLVITISSWAIWTFIFEKLIIGS